MRTKIDLPPYTVNVQIDEQADNPFDLYDCEPPLLSYTCHRSPDFRAYNDAPKTWRGLLALLPASLFERGQRVAFIRHCLNTSLGYFARHYLPDHGGDLRDALAECLKDEMGAEPYGWRDARAWLEHAAAILEYGGIACHFAESHGHCQGDSALLLAIATPAWVAKVGAPADSLPRQCESACELWGQWAWGDVYGISSIEDENGDEIEDSACWGFYGSDHEKSGLLDHAREVLRRHESDNAKQAAHFAAALCSAE